MKRCKDCKWVGTSYCYGVHPYGSKCNTYEPKMTKNERLDWICFWGFVAIGAFDVYLAISPYDTISQVVHGWPKAVMLAAGVICSAANLWAIQRGYANAALSFIRALIIGHVFLYF